MKYSIQSLGYHIEFFASYYSDKIAVKYYHKYRFKSYTYQKILNLSYQTSRYLSDLGLKRGDKLILYASNCPEWIVLMFACALTGIILVPIDYNHTDDFIKKIITLSKPKCIFTDKTNINIKNIPIKNIEYLLNEIQNLSFDALLEKEDFINGDTIFEIAFSSGSTDIPKGVIIKNKNLTSNIHSLRLRLGKNINWVLLSFLPLSHMFEQMLGCFCACVFGGTIIYHKQKRMNELLKIGKSEKITGIVLVPALLSLFKSKFEEQFQKKQSDKILMKLIQFLSILPFPARRLCTCPIRWHFMPFLDSFVCGGASLDETTELFWRNLGYRVLQGYGLTEASPIVTCNEYDYPITGSAGKPLKHQYIKINKDGELLIAGENIISEYFTKVIQPEEMFENGWLKTGDLGHIDEAGNLFITGRKKNIIVLENGLNVFPEDIERQLKHYPEIQEVCVFADQQKNKTSLIAMVIVKNNNQDINSLKQKLNEQLTSHQRLHEIIIWPNSSFPKTTTQKIKKQEIVQTYQEIKNNSNSQKLKTPQPDSLAQQVKEILSMITKLPTNKINEQHLLMQDLAIDSLGIIQLMIEIDTVFKIEIDSQLLNNKTRVNDLIDTLKAPPPKSKPFKLPLWPFNPFFSIWRKLNLTLFNKLILKNFFQLKITNSFNINKSSLKPIILVANHQSHLDTVAILAALPNQIRSKITIAAADDYFFNNTLSSILLRLLFNIFPFFRSTNFEQNFKNIGKLLDLGNHILIFPEGTRSRNGQMSEFKRGIGMLIKEVGYPSVLPIKINNTFNLWPFNKKIPKRGQIEIIMGDLQTFQHETPDEMTRILEQTIRAL